MTRSSEEIELEVEATRAGLDETVEALKSKMSPGQIIDELTSSLKGTGAADMFGNLGSQVKENPMALALIGAGVAWMMMGKRDAQAASGFDGGAHRTAYGVDTMADTYPPEPASWNDDRTFAPHSLKDKVADAAHNAADRLRDGAASVQDGVRNAADHARDGAHAIGSGAARAGHKVQDSFMDTLDREPLVIGAIALAVGAAIGASLPSTRLEDRTFGEARDHLVDDVKTMATDGLHQAKDAAGAAIAGLKRAAQDEGLVGASDGGGSLVDKAETVIKAGVDAAKTSIEESRAN